MQEHPDRIKAGQSASLVKKAQNGDKESIYQLMTICMPLIRKYASANGFYGLEREDMMQEGLIGLLKAISSFDLLKDTSFQSYAAICIRNSVYSAARRAAGKKNLPLINYLPLDNEQEIKVEEKAVNSPEEYVLEKERFNAIRTLMEESLSDFELKALNLYLTGESYHQIADTLGTTQKAVDNALQRVRRKFKSTY